MPQHETCHVMEEANPKLNTILLAEADAIVRKALRRTLENSGHRVLETATGEEALDLCQHYDGHIDLFLSDIALPGVRGPGLARLVISLRPLTRIIFLTGASEETNSRAGICPGCWLLIRKPFRPQELAHAVREFLNRPAFQLSSANSFTELGLVGQR